MRCLLVRHAESTANREARLQGRADYPLSDAGYRQAEALHARFRAQDPAPTHLYASPLARAFETARIAAGAWALPIEPWAELQEYDVGLFTGLTWDEIRARHPEHARRFEQSRDWDQVPQAESAAARAARGRHVAETLLARHADTDTVVLFTHGGILQHILAALLGTSRTWGVAAGNTAIFDLELDRSTWWRPHEAPPGIGAFRLCAFNDTAHLNGASAPPPRGPDDV